MNNQTSAEVIDMTTGLADLLTAQLMHCEMLCIAFTTKMENQKLNNRLFTKGGREGNAFTPEEQILQNQLDNMKEHHQKLNVLREKVVSDDYEPGTIMHAFSIVLCELTQTISKHENILPIPFSERLNSYRQMTKETIEYYKNRPLQQQGQTLGELLREMAGMDKLKKQKEQKKETTNEQ